MTSALSRLSCALLVLTTAQGCASALPVYGRVVGARHEGGIHEVPDTVFEVELVNEGTVPCRLTAYTVAWGDGLLAGRHTCRAREVLGPSMSTRRRCAVPSGSQLGATPGLSRPRVVDVELSCKATR